jgi:hypothetical protein
MLSESDGSAYVELGNTKVLIAIYGPKPVEGRPGFVERATVHADVKYAPFSGRSRDIKKVQCDKHVAHLHSSSPLSHFEVILRAIVVEAEACFQVRGVARTPCKSVSDGTSPYCYESRRNVPRRCVISRLGLVCSKWKWTRNCRLAHLS